MMKPESKRTITIEDLLRLKRAERPPAEFWTEFDRALRAKQLAALVEKRPWWQTMPRVFVGFRRYGIPIGAATILAVTVFSFRHSPSKAVTPPQHTAAQPETMAAVVPTSASSEVRSETVAANAVRTDDPNNGEEKLASDANASAVALASGATAPGEISRMLIGTSANEANDEALSPSARAIAANLATVRGSEPVLARTLLATAGSSEVRASRPVIEPLHQIASPTDRRRSNLLTAMVSMPAFDGPVHTGDRAAARLSEDELYDRIHRFGVAGPRGLGGSMKF